MLNLNDPRLARLERSQRAAWIWDPRGRRILWATKQAAELWGFEDAFLLIDRPFGASDPSTADLDLAASALAHTEGVETEIRLVHSGRARNIEVMGRVFARTDEGDFILFTHQPAIGAERGEAHPIAPLFNPFPLGLALFTPLGKLLYANPVYERLVGRERTRLSDLLGSQKGAERFIRALLAAGTLRLTPTLTLDGIERALQIDAALAEDPRSHRAAFLVEVHDVTARRAHERALAERSLLLKDLLGEAIEGWAVLDRRERVVAFGGRMLEDAPGSDTTIGLPWREAAKIFAISGADADRPARLARREERQSVRIAHESALIEAQSVLGEEGERAGFHLFLRAGTQEERGPRTGELLDLDLLPILVHDNFEIVFANARAARLFGAEKAAALIGRPFLDLFPDDERRASRHYDDLAQAGPGASAAARLAARDAAGRTLHLEATFRNGEIAGRRVVIAGFNDITPLMEAEDAAAPAREDAAPLFELAPAPLLLLDRHGRIARANDEAARFLGLSEGEILERPFEELIDKADRTAFEIRQSAAHTAGSNVSVLDLHLRARGGAASLTRLKLRALPGGEGALLVSLHDLAAQKTIEAELARAAEAAEERNRQKTSFLSAVSHEMRTPLNAIIGFSEFMRDGRLGPIGNEKYAGYVNDILASGQHLLSLVNDLLDISKIEAGRLDLAFAPVDVAAVIEQCLRIMAPQAEKKGIVLAGSFPRTLPKVMADARSVRQIVLNLLSNAVKFTPGTGRVVARAAFDPARGVAIEIEDTGIGMSEEELKAALEPFRQVHGRAANDEPGTGLGLPLAKALAEANHAVFRIESVRDKGTRAEIVFPASQVLADGTRGA